LNETNVDGFAKVRFFKNLALQAVEIIKGKNLMNNPIHRAENIKKEMREIASPLPLLRNYPHTQKTASTLREFDPRETYLFACSITDFFSQLVDF